MPQPFLSSRRNPLVAEFRHARDRGRPDSFLIEGVRFVEDALRATGALRCVMASATLARTDRGASLLEGLERAGVPVTTATEDVIEAATGTRTNQGVAGIASVHSADPEAMFSTKNAFVVIAAGVADPGNAGTLLRTAAAAGATGFVSLEGGVSIFNDKALRAAAGSIFTIPVANAVSIVILQKILAAGSIHAVSTAATGGVSYDEIKWGPRVAVILGGEAGGVPPAISGQAKEIITIPISNQIESLNVAAAGAVICFEIARFRRRDR